ncbi:unnamed protein product [Prorocentrum cordatum]|uniref:cellulose 1,4-beta-cellobiosidase (non-reducing end) n=1 Tax=Prorocentrum cordatum TaxID=2364126 RepID=A0ABN9UBA3_9DINO|nr:unnamed protein product [Polarella glacialis]
MGRALAALALAVAALGAGQVARGASCPGTVQVAGGEGGAPLPVSLVPTGWGSPDGGAEFEVDGSGNVVPHMGSRAYFALECTPGEYDNRQYMGFNLLGKSLRYTVDLSGAGCGCNAALYLTSMNLNEKKSECGDHYCDANNVCGESCAEIDIQEANMYAWHSTLHVESDPSGVGGGYGGGGRDWTGPRDWTGMQYSPGGTCIDTSEPFQVAASFPVNASGWLAGMAVELSQAGRSCALKTSITSYEGMEELSRAVRAGMTPVLSYWSDDDMLWMDGLGKDEKGPCKSDSAADCSETVKFFNFSVGDLDRETTAEEVPAALAAGAVEDSLGAFCCLASRGEGDFCGSCPAYARTGPSSHCGASESSCAACGGRATWCTDAAPPQAADTSAPGPPPLPGPTLAAEADRAAPTAAPAPLAVPAAAPAAALRAADGGFCCLASAGAGADLCGQCFPGARALPGSRCGGSSSDCHACGGKAAWCEEAAVQPAAAGGGGEDGQCCLAAMDSGDFCGSCFPSALANSSSRCGQSRAACEGCGGASRWCRLQSGGGGAAALVRRGLERPADDAAGAEPFDCKAGLAKWESGWSQAKKTWCCEVKGSPCLGTTTASAEATNAVAEATTAKATTATAEDAGSDRADVSDGSFCCLAASEASDVCGTCFENARAERSSHCGASADGCDSCGGMSTWCSTARSAIEQRKSPVSNMTRAVKDSPTGATGFCCLAAEEGGGDFCGTCFPNAMVQGDSRCGESQHACENCGGAARWCNVSSVSDALGGEVEAEHGGAGSTTAAPTTTTSRSPKPSPTSAASKMSTTVGASETSTTRAALKGSTSGAPELSTTSAASKMSTIALASQTSTTRAAVNSSTTRATSTSTAASLIPEPKCPGVVQIGSDGLSDLPAHIVPTGWGSEYGPVPVHVANHSTISASMGARAYFAMSCTAGSYSNDGYMALNLLGFSLRYTVDLSGAGCGCNAALYLTSMRQNKNASTCSDYYCDANSVCGVACAEIDIQEANMHSWHSTLHGQDDPNGVGGGFGGGAAEWSGPRDWNASQYSPGGACIDTRRPFDVDAAFPVDADGSLAAMVVTLSQEGKSCPLSTLTAAYAGMPELTEALRAGMTPIVSYWSADDMLWMDGQGKDKLGACKRDRPDRCAESVRFSNFSVGVAPALPPTASPTPVPTAEPTPRPTAAQTSAPTSEPAPGPQPTGPEGFCCLAAPNPFDYCGSCPAFARAPEGSGCAASEGGCGRCGPLARWCGAEAPRTFTTSHAPPRSGRATVRLGAEEVEAEVVGTPRGAGSASELQGKFGGRLGAVAGQGQRRGPPQALLCLPGLAVLAFAARAWLRRGRRGPAGAGTGPPPSARPMVQAEDSELEFA